jgi:Ca-activated chloride channel family protein
MPVQMHPETAVGELKAGAYTFPLQEVEVKGDVQGLLYSATVTQKFSNERNERMEAVYVFPLPPKAAVHGFKLIVGDRVIEGEIKERGQARREYKQAVQQGHRAALMEEERSDIFTTTVGNIGPGEEVTISFDMSGPLSCFKNTGKLTLPLVVGEVFIPGNQLAGDSVGDGTGVDTDEVPDASRITPPRLADGAPNPVQLSVQFTVHPAGLQMSQVQSTCHFARTKKFEDGRVRVSLLPGVERMDRAFVLEVVYPENTLQTSLLVDDETNTFALTVVPPVTNERTKHPRDVVILLDRSGSMGGWPMIAARRATARIIDSLTEQDRFGIIAYDNRNDHFDFKGGLRPADNFYKMKAAEWLSKIDAQGGTQVLPALRDGMTYFRLSDNRDPHIILLTDGDVGNDSSLIRTCQQGVRISTVGIGYAAREGLLNRMAETSGGLCSLIPNEADLDKDLADMHRKWGQPVWKGLTLRGADAEFRSPKFWDVWQDVPSTFFGQLDDPMAKTQVRGWLQGQGEYIEELSPIAVEGQVVYRSWARSRLLDLEDLFLVSKASAQDMVKLSVNAQVLCRFTAFTAVDKAEKVNTEQRMQQVMQPVEQTIQKKKRAFLGGGNRAMRAAPSQSAARPMLRQSFSAPPPAPEPVMDMFCESPAPSAGAPMAFDDADDSLFAGDASMESLLEAEAPCAEALDSGWLGGGGDAGESFEMFDRGGPTFGAPPPKPIRTGGGPLFKKPTLGGGGPKKEKAEQSSGAMKIKTMLQRDTLLHLGESPSKEALKDCLDIAKALIKEVTEGLRNGSLSSGDNRWREFVSKLMDYSEALEEAIASGSLKPARQLRKELETMLNRS